MTHAGDGLCLVTLTFDLLTLINGFPGLTVEHFYDVDVEVFAIALLLMLSSELLVSAVSK